MPNTPHNALKGLFKVIGTFALLAGLCLVTALPAVAADATEINDVIINGYKLGFFEQLALEDHIDQDIADGYYWFELDTGMWGADRRTGHRAYRCPRGLPGIRGNPFK